jgi:hypothetical protein
MNYYKDDKYLYAQPTAAATATIGELTVTAKDSSAAGNLISVTIPESGTESQVTVSVSGNAITCAIGTSNDMGADDIVTAIQASAAASALVTVAAGGTTHITSAVSETFLSGGEAGTMFPLSSFAGMQPTGDSTLTLYFKSMRNFDGYAIGANEVIISDSVDITLATANTHRAAMDAICNVLGSSEYGAGDIVIGDDRNGLASPYLSNLITGVAVNTASANS